LPIYWKYRQNGKVDLSVAALRCFAKKETRTKVGKSFLFTAFVRVFQRLRLRAKLIALSLFV
jgi:hypothetical protein